ncbi:MAG: tryptophan transporter [Syntrophomonas sp.]
MDDMKLEVTGQKNTKLVSVIVTAVLIGIGAALRSFAPPIFTITPNLVIAMYCLAIILVRPKMSGALVIGIVGGVVSMLTSKSPNPYLNLITEPAGALACYLIVTTLPNLSIFKYMLKPILATFIGTLASGSLYVILNAVFFAMPTPVAIGAFVSVVLPTATINTVIAYVLYLPSQKVLNLEPQNV